MNRVIPTIGACAGCSQNAALRPGAVMPRDLRGLAAAAVTATGTGPKPAGMPKDVSRRTARLLQISGITVSAVFAVGGLIASARGNEARAAQFALFSILSGAAVGIARVFVEEEEGLL
ncbi:MAG: hypothetical protein GY769_20060 [bacterium]|nr:hypothetical protein [bacterium]